MASQHPWMCLGECVPCICHSCTCIPTDIHMWQRYANSVHICFVICQEFPLTFAHLPPTQRTLANGEQTWPNAFVHVCSIVLTWRMHMFACVWPKTFAKYIHGFIQNPWSIRRMTVYEVFYSTSYTLIPFSAWNITYGTTRLLNSRFL